MLASLAIAVAINQGAEVDPLALPIGRKGRVSVGVGQLVDLRSGRVATAEDVARAAANSRYVYVGEEHDNLKHHEMQAEVIRALAKSGRNVVVGMEQLTRPVQPSLAPWTMGWWSDEEFIAKVDWKKQWGMDYSLYKPIFDAAKELNLPIVALNVPRDWVRAVGKQGFAGLTDEQKSQLPSTMDLTNKSHRQVFEALIGGHTMTGMENMYSAQVLWDCGMADTAIKYMDEHPSPKTVMVVVAGSGHVMYGQGINWRVKERTGDAGVTVTMATSDKTREVAAGVGDFLYLTEPSKK